jgi:hypothetical protein
MKVCISLWLIVLAVSAALAQEKRAVPPTPKPADEGPSLEVTMKFIQEKLNGLGPVNYVAHVHDNSGGKDWENQFSVLVTNLVADPGTCRIDYRLKTARDGAVLVDSAVGFTLRAIEDIRVMPGDQYLQELATAGGYPSFSVKKVDPPVLAFRVRGNDKKNSDFLFLDERLADRVAKALVHAAELCGGGTKPEPF